DVGGGVAGDRGDVVNALELHCRPTLVPPGLRGRGRCGRQSLPRGWHDRAVKDGSVIPRFGRARRDPGLAVLEGFHPVKQALRFGATLQLLVTSDPRELSRLARELAPELAAQMTELARPVDEETFRALSALAPTTPVIALAERPAVDAVDVLTQG